VPHGKGLFEDAELLRDFDRYGTSLALTILAEEEFAKAFLLYLLQDKAIPSTPEVWRALRDHHCKHLLTVFMEYLHSDAEQFSVRVKAQYDPKRRLPREVASAVNLFRHERIRRWESPHSKVLERGDYDNETKRLPNNIDRAKQNAIYVDISPEGKTVTTPVSVTAEQVKLEMEKCSRLRELGMEVEAGYVLLSQDFARLKDSLALVFTPPVVSEVGDLCPGVRIYSELWQLAALEATDEE
jgi:AbiV family abortive infection protein